MIGERVADQLLSALGTTIKLSAASVKNFKLHPHDGNKNVPAITSDKPDGNFPLTGGACQQYVHFPMEWQLAAAKVKKVCPPQAASVHRYDDEIGEYNGPEQVSGVIVVLADGDIKNGTKNEVGSRRHRHCNLVERRTDERYCQRNPYSRGGPWLLS